jgi:predicted RNA polymerase sigma factor
MQLGSLLRSSRRRGPDVWEFRYRERPHNGRRYEVPAPQELPERLGAVLQVISYLVFNEGYSAAAGAEVTRAELTGEAIRLGRLLTDLQPEPEVIGLLSLMLLQECRRAARTSPTGELILLENQNRSLWNRRQVAEGVALRPFMRRRNRSLPPTGGRLLRFTTD